MPLPGNSSYVPVPAQTLKNPNVSKTLNTQKTATSTIKAQPRKQQDEIAEEIYEDEDLEEYYDDDFEEYEEPTSARKIEIKR